MARYRKVDTRIWNDQRFNSLTDDGKLVFMFLLTHQHLTPIGGMRITIAGLASELHWAFDRFNSAFQDIVKLGMVKFDEQSSMLWLPNFIKYNRPESPNVVISWEELLDYLPECELKNELIKRTANFVSTMNAPFFKALPEVFRKTMPNQEQEQEQDQEQEQEQEKENASSELDSLSEKSILSTTTKYDSSNKTKAIEVLNFLNIKTNKAFTPDHENLKWITERLSDGEDVDTCRQVIVRKLNDWRDSTSMLSQLNPRTLFKKDNYVRYKGQLVLPKVEESNSVSAE